MHNNPTAVAGMQITGSRERQEDSFCIKEFAAEDTASGLLLVLCDGMGGRKGGEVASRLVLDTFSEAMQQEGIGVPWRLANAMEVANRKLADRIKEEHRLTGMGTTLIAAVISGDQLYWLSVGDSPMWLYRGGRLQRLNADHSMKAVLDRQVAAGEISAEAAARDVTRHYLLSVLCGTPPPMIDLPRQPFHFQAGDQLLLASDGVETLSGEQIAEILRSFPDKKPGEVLAALMGSLEGEKHPQQDNATAILVKWAGIPGTEQEAQRVVETDGQHAVIPAGIGLRLVTAAALTALAIGALLYIL